MKASDMIPSKYLRQEDVDGEPIVTVKSLKKVNVAQEDEAPDYKWTAMFFEFERPLVLNATNIKRISKYLGDDTDGWVGNTVRIYVDPDVAFGGKTVGGIRVKAAPKAGAKATAHDEDEDSDDAVNRKLADATGGSSPF